MAHSRGNIPKQATLGSEKYNLDTIETATIKGANSQLESVMTTLVADGHIVSASGGATVSSGQMFITASDAVHATAANDFYVVCVKR